MNVNLLPAMLLLITLGFFANSAACTFYVPLNQIDEICFWFRPDPAPKLPASHEN